VKRDDREGISRQEKPQQEKPRQEKPRQEKPRRDKDADDGRVIVDMNVEGFPWYRKNGVGNKKHDPDTPTKKELWAMIRAAYLAYLPYFLILLGVFVAVFLIGYLILR
jgi:hypothetical protein